jgi:hypothetical protein
LLSVAKTTDFGDVDVTVSAVFAAFSSSLILTM